MFTLQLSLQEKSDAQLWQRPCRVLTHTDHSLTWRILTEELQELTTEILKLLLMFDASNPNLNALTPALIKWLFELTDTLNIKNIAAKAPLFATEQQTFTSHHYPISNTGSYSKPLDFTKQIPRTKSTALSSLLADRTADLQAISQFTISTREQSRRMCLEIDKLIQTTVAIITTILVQSCLHDRQLQETWLNFVVKMTMLKMYINHLNYPRVIYDPRYSRLEDDQFLHSLLKQLKRLRTSTICGQPVLPPWLILNIQNLKPR